MKSAHSGAAGFSLIELVVTVAILAILAAIAVSTYGSYTLQAHRTDAIRALATDRQIMERCYSQYYAYNNAGCPALAPVSPNSYYGIGTSNLTATTYTLTATATGHQANDTACATFNINQAGTQGSTGTGTTQTCWGSN